MRMKKRKRLETEVKQNPDPGARGNEIDLDTIDGQGVIWRHIGPGGLLQLCW